MYKYSMPVPEIINRFGRANPLLEIEGHVRTGTYSTVDHRTMDEGSKEKATR